MTPAAELYLRPTSDGEVVRRAALGHPDAWQELLDRFEHLVLSVARRNGLGPDEAADVAQATWLRLLEHIDELRDPDRIAGWLATVARREAWKLNNTSRRNLPCDTLPETRDRGTLEDDVSERLDRGRTRQALATAMAQLPPTHRNLLRCLVSDNTLSYSQVAQRVGVPIGSIGPTRQRCLAKLRKAPELAYSR